MSYKAKFINTVDKLIDEIKEDIGFYRLQQKDYVEIKKNLLQGNFRIDKQNIDKVKNIYQCFDDIQLDDKNKNIKDDVNVFHRHLCDKLLLIEKINTRCRLYPNNTKSIVGIKYKILQCTEIVLQGHWNKKENRKKIQDNLLDIMSHTNKSITPANPLSLVLKDIGNITNPDVDLSKMLCTISLVAEHCHGFSGKFSYCAQYVNEAIKITQFENSKLGQMLPKIKSKHENINLSSELRDQDETNNSSNKNHRPLVNQQYLEAKEQPSSLLTKIRALRATYEKNQKTNKYNLLTMLLAVLDGKSVTSDYNIVNYVHNLTMFNQVRMTAQNLFTVNKFKQGKSNQAEGMDAIRIIGRLSEATKTIWFTPKTKKMVDEAEKVILTLTN